jgi:hypothetical protein
VDLKALHAKIGQLTLENEQRLSGAARKLIEATGAGGAG